MIDLKRYWWPVAPLAELDASRPVGRTLHGIPLVLFLDAEGKPAALHDRCPHRHARFPAGRFTMVRSLVPFTAGAFPLMAAAQTYRA